MRYYSCRWRVAGMKLAVTAFSALVVWLFLSMCIPGAVGTCNACTSLLVTKGASEDGSVIITYTCDGEFHPHLEYEPPADYEPDDSVEITDWRGNTYGKIPQVKHTYGVMNLMNEHQLAIGETTFDGREELKNPDGMLSYWDLIFFALQRARTARQAIEVMTDLVAAHGYRSTGESFSIADPNEAWIMEMIGPGEGGEGAIWVALRVPDGYMSCHANKARIGEFPLDDPQNCLYSNNVISFAIERGFYDAESDGPFRFCDVYCPPTPENLKYCSTRVWSIFRRAAPSQDFSPDYHRAVKGAEPYPLWVKPDRKLSLGDVFGLMRDHYEGTPYDATTGVDAGPYGNPNRWRPLNWMVDSVTYAWERPISTQQTGFSMVTQSRSWLPDGIGGVQWYGVDDTYTTCYAPLYCCLDSIPKSYATGSIMEFTWDSAWWIFNLVANYACLKYSWMLPEIQQIQSDIESSLLAIQPSVEKTALDLAGKDPQLMKRYLTDYSITQSEMVVSRWRDLAVHLITKYNDGYVKNEEGEAEDAGYPEAWLKEVVRARPGWFELAPQGADTTGWKLID
jgi:dipeptidase